MLAYRDVIVGLALLSKKRSYSPYISSMLLNLYHLLNWKNNDLPSWILFKQRTTLLNEESGEISLSVLSKLVVSDTHKDSHATQNTAYSLLRLYHQITNGFEEELDIIKKRKLRTYITEEAPEVLLISKCLVQGTFFMA